MLCFSGFLALDQCAMEVDQPGSEEGALLARVSIVFVGEVEEGVEAGEGDIFDGECDIFESERRDCAIVGEHNLFLLVD